ncbi:hypothetical protein BAUCODRAFT_568984 [Baudoinia panamericana UAMH 10762]|uniref:Uncharacterized protein n=1 Tax=Baudoinia panamericana (strain UAMH 10762) TaxID=717646 RepID=M2M8S2_BAUPA|nr:uncharacterized protein BAUCODRAFT_568984 [Baudoinia panamericana UAMH 10762]EMC92806.1 hypothetical protein BAUCODRAFT_568984 [Baudoinia panamericana UAMH 10762]
MAPLTRKRKRVRGVQEPRQLAPESIAARRKKPKHAELSHRQARDCSKGGPGRAPQAPPQVRNQIYELVLAPDICGLSRCSLGTSKWYTKDRLSTLVQGPGPGRQVFNSALHKDFEDAATVVGHSSSTAFRNCTTLPSYRSRSQVCFGLPNGSAWKHYPSSSKLLASSSA